MIDQLGLVLLVIFALVRSTYGLAGGTTVTTSEFPFVAQLPLSCKRYLSSPIIHEFFIITMAEHIYHLRDVEPVPTKLLKVIVGLDRTSENGTQYGVEKVIIHPSFRTDSVFSPYNIALVKLKHPIHFNDIVKPVPLVEANPPSGKKGWLISFGVASEAEKWSDEHFLRAAELTLSQRAKWKTFAVVTKPDGNKSVCPGDAGAPYVIDGKLVGINIGYHGYCNHESWLAYGSIVQLRQWIDDTEKENLKHVNQYI